VPGRTAGKAEGSTGSSGSLVDRQPLASVGGTRVFSVGRGESHLADGRRPHTKTMVAAAVLIGSFERVAAAQPVVVQLLFNARVSNAVARQLMTFWAVDVPSTAGETSPLALSWASRREYRCRQGRGLRSGGVTCTRPAACRPLLRHHRFPASGFERPSASSSTPKSSTSVALR